MEICFSQSSKIMSIIFAAIHLAVEDLECSQTARHKLTSQQNLQMPMGKVEVTPAVIKPYSIKIMFTLFS